MDLLDTLDVFCYVIGVSHIPVHAVVYLSFRFIACVVIFKLNRINIWTYYALFDAFVLVKFLRTRNLFLHDVYVYWKEDDWVEYTRLWSCSVECVEALLSCKSSVSTDLDFLLLWLRRTAMFNTLVVDFLCALHITEYLLRFSLQLPLVFF